MKIIKVGRCADCPYVSNAGYLGRYFGRYSCKNVYKIIVSTGLIPKWCPLEEAKE